MISIFFISTFFICLRYANGQSACTTFNGGDGQCVPMSDCTQIMNSSADAAAAAHLSTNICGVASDDVSMVCCTTNATNTCTTPDGRLGTCIGVHSCPSVLTMMWPATPENIAYVTKLKCDGPEKYSVCCAGPATTTTQPPRPTAAATHTSACTLTATPPDPSTGCCGRDSGGIPRNIPGNVTNIDQYNWSSLIEYTKGNGTMVLCGGVLISGRYMLTSALCVTAPLRIGWTPINVRLGEYDTTNPGLDCVEVADGKDCTTVTQVIPIARTVTHPDFYEALRGHDIGLIRLSQLVLFADFIRPICLPSSDITQAPTNTLRLSIAGWGLLRSFSRSSNIKLHETLLYIPDEVCQAALPIRDEMFCAGGRHKDTCRGDPGGPLITNNGGTMELVGITILWPSTCNSSTPTVYTNVYKHLPWITSQIEA